LALRSFKCTNFRCLESVSLEFEAANNLIYGANASGKTSILEGIAYLGRGRSFRGAATTELIRHDAQEFVLTGVVDTGARKQRIGVRNGREGMEVRVDGERSSSAAPLAEAIPLQIIEPDVHELIAGGPENRRRYIDWIAFHVEHSYLDSWRRYRRSLKQRNAALKAGAGTATLDSWDKELAEHGLAVDSARRRMLEITLPALGETGRALLGTDVTGEYQQGWSNSRDLLSALRAGHDRDRQLGSTQAGPHRADLRLNFEDHQARKLVSRGQEKLLGCALILAATEVVQTAIEKPLLLLIDDPAAELDAGSLARLMGQVGGLGCQVIATALVPDAPLFGDRPRMFHVEHGLIEQA